uniref:Uncharacterized protein n=1 Tax=Nelumbo nucifera TaxID=4432 RepID=A0A822XNW6_NELNU|nr:TPA_asm: hypothetical protein HUJ06_023563 [Nelumbo nucifera]
MGRKMRGRERTEDGVFRKFWVGELLEGGFVVAVG